MYTRITDPQLKGADCKSAPAALHSMGINPEEQGKEGKLRVVFHAHNSKGKIHPRHMYISTVDFENEGEKEVMVIDENYMIPVFEK